MVRDVSVEHAKIVASLRKWTLTLTIAMNMITHPTSGSLYLLYAPTITFFEVNL